MPHQFSIRDIARQAGVSTATVDRVLNGRPGVRWQTTEQVRHAITELEGQSAQLFLAGRKMLIDVVMDAPARFSTAVRNALESEFPRIGPAVFRARFHVEERMGSATCLEVLERIRSRGSDGVILKAVDDEAVAAEISHLRRAGIPVVTLVTDLPLSERVAYVGMDNRAAGSTAAYMMANWLHDQGSQSIAVVVSQDAFRGEEEREMGFRSTIRQLAPGRVVHYLSQSDGLDSTTEELVLGLLRRDKSVGGVYSIGGGNRGIVSAFRQAGFRPGFFIGHDLVPENVQLLKSGEMNMVIHHDLKADARNCCSAFMGFHSSSGIGGKTAPSHVELVTAYNLPILSQEPPGNFLGLDG